MQQKSCEQHHKLTFPEQENAQLYVHQKIFRIMIKKILLVSLVITGTLTSKAQLMEAFVHEGEFGLSVGMGHYLGDLTAGMKLYNGKPKLSGGVFFKKQFNNYVGLKVAANYAFVGYADKYTSFNDNRVKKVRNLSFNTNIWELSVSGDFNFFRFQPEFPEYRYTPYVSLGVGAFIFDPYAYLNGQKYNLRSLGTEGQGSAAYPDRKPYSTMAMCFPLAVGLKYGISDKVNIFAEVCYRFTTTDYLDDVSGSYAPDAFPADPNGNPSAAYQLQDRSYEYGTPIGIKGRQRGNSSQKDSYGTVQIGLSFNIGSYRCPTY